MAEGGSGGQVERWLSIGATIVAPATVLGTLLFYFGYVSSRAEYAYFGVDVDTIGLSTQDYVMRSPQPLLVPLLVLSILGAGLLASHLAIRRWVASSIVGAPDDDAGREDRPRSERHHDPVRRLTRGAAIAGLVVLGAGVLLLFGYPYFRDWPLYNLVTPLMIATGTGLVGYAAAVAGMARRLRHPATERTGPLADSAVLSRGAAVLGCVVIAAGVFWATATVAQWSGRGVAEETARHLDQLPSVIVDTHERLFLRSPGIEETALPASAGQTFHYRYRRLRLLIDGHDRMFLVPETWSASDSTLIVPLDGSVRVQFQFENQPP